MREEHVRGHETLRTCARTLAQMCIHRKRVKCLRISLTKARKEEDKGVPQPPPSVLHKHAYSHDRECIEQQLKQSFERLEGK